jgi:hypothetical protein
MRANAGLTAITGGSPSDDAYLAKARSAGKRLSTRPTFGRCSATKKPFDSPAPFFDGRVLRWVGGSIVSKFT